MYLINRILFLFGLLGILLSLSSCSQKNSEGFLYGEDLKKAAKIFSTRPQDRSQEIILLKLSQPALLSVLKTDKLKNAINVDLAKSIKEEQDQIIAKLKEISPEVLVLYRYKMVLNAITIVAPAKDITKIQAVAGITLIKKSQSFDRPKALFASKLETVNNNFAINNSALFIGAKAAYDKNILGQNIRVGIIDTGIDYTHSMMGGSGLVDDYKKINPAEDSTMFPNLKVVGGVDFVGTKFNAASDVFSNRIPVMDNNPMDEGGHGTHVAGTVSGIGDGVNSYNGVAPSGMLYALKVFGSEGSTSDEVVIAALEFAADPNGDGNLDDRLDVVNLSLGSSFGSPKIFYNLAIKNLTLGGTVVVCSAGNSGDVTYIVGAPSVSDEALSVAASIDSMEHNWKFRAVSLKFADQSELVVEAVESSMTKPIANLGEAQGKMVFAGLANKDYSEEEKAQIKNNVALIDRGEVTFSEKIKRAEAAGAIGVVIVNNTDGEPFGMGGDGKYNIPAIMIAKDLGVKVKAAMKMGDVVLNFKVDKTIEKSNLIDTVTDFSSRGPRSEDSLIKPEISAPGQNIISANMGQGKETIQLSGTSMSGPHIAGVMALMKQYYPELSVQELKSVLMGTAKSLNDKNGKPYSISRVGAGRVQIDKALSAGLVSSKVSISLGDVRIDKQKKMTQSLNLKNIKTEDIKLTAVFEGHPALVMDPLDFTIGAKQEQLVTLKFNLSAKLINTALEEVDGYIKFYSDKVEVLRLPVLAMVRKISGIVANSLVVNSTSKIDSDGSLVELSLTNFSEQKGKSYPMNLIMMDERKKDTQHDGTKSNACDLQSVGYKIVKNQLYVGFKLYQQVTTWNLCELNMQIDSNEDGLADQEIVGSTTESLEGLPTTGQFATLNIDANKARALRKEFENLPNDKKTKKPNYAEAVLDAKPLLNFNHSSIAIMVIDLDKIKVSPTGEFLVKFATSSREDYAIEPDDYLESDGNQWRRMDMSVKSQGYIFNELEVDFESQQTKLLNLTKGQGTNELLLLTPSNRSVLNAHVADEQLEVVRAKYIQ